MRKSFILSLIGILAFLPFPAFVLWVRSQDLGFGALALMPVLLVLGLLSIFLGLFFYHRASRAHAKELASQPRAIGTGLRRSISPMIVILIVIILVFAVLIVPAFAQFIYFVLH